MRACGGRTAERNEKRQRKETAVRRGALSFVALRNFNGEEDEEIGKCRGGVEKTFSKRRRRRRRRRFKAKLRM